MTTNGSLNVLLVEDDDDLREILCRRLSRRGFSVAAVEKPAAALEAAAVRSFQVAIVDRTLRGASGFELVESLKRLDPEMQIIVMSGAFDEEAFQRAKSLGASDYLIKPFALCDLEVAIGRVCQDAPA